MYEDLIFPLVIILFLLFIVVVPMALYTGIRRIANPVPFWLPLLLAFLVLLAMEGIFRFRVIGNDSVLAGTLVYFSLLLLLTSLAVITPYLWFGKRTGINRPWLVFSLLSFISVGLMFFTTMGESREGGPLPQFFQMLPLTGWIFDGLANLLHIQDIAYSATLTVHTLLLAIGLYLEVFIIAGLFYILPGVLSPAKNE